MNKIYLYHHLGLGDHISCHGIVRYYCEKYDEVSLFVKPHNLDNVKFMYNDIQNLEYLVGDDKFAMQYLSDNMIRNVKVIGFQLRNDINFELQFYNMAGVPIEYKHSKFFINRDKEKEQELFDSLDIEPGEYTFLHTGGYELNKSMISGKVVEPLTHGFFDWMTVIENAKEIHCIDSSFLCLIDCMELSDYIKLFNHRYVRKYPEYIKLYTNKKWNFLK